VRMRSLFSAGGFRWLLVAVWMLLIFLGASIPASSLPDGPEIASVVIHLFEYFILTILLMWAINGGFARPVIIPVIAAAIVLAAFYAISDEIHQLFVPGRVSDLLDIAVDLTGVLGAVVLIVVIGKKSEDPNVLNINKKKKRLQRS
jgi:VanZ family protein